MSSKFCVTIVEAKLNREIIGKYDLFAVLKFQGRHHRTLTLTNAGLNPVWNQLFEIKVKDLNLEVELEIWDAGTSSDTIIGNVSFSLKKIL